MSPALLLPLLLAASPTGPLSPDEAVRLALQSSPSLQALVERRDEERAQADAATDLANPQLRVTNLRSDRLLSPAFSSDPYPAHPLEDASLALRWSPPSLGTLGARGAQGARRVDAADAAIQVERQAVAAQVRALHATVRSLDLQVALARTTVQVRQKIQELIRQRLAENAAKSLDGSMADLDYLDALTHHQELQSKRRQALRNLAVLLGAPPGTALELSGDGPACKVPEGSLDALLEEAAQVSPRLKERRMQVAAVEAERARAQLDVVPWLDFVQLGYVFGGDDAPNGHAALRLGISLPLFNWNGNTLRMLEHRRARLAEEEQAAARALGAGLAQTLDELKEEAALAESYRQADADVIEKSLAKLQGALEVGGSDLVQVAMVQARAMKARREGLQAQLRCQLAVIELDRLLGRGAP